VKVWEAQTGQLALSLKGRTWEVTSVAFSPDGKRLAAWGTAGRQLTWDVTTGQRIAAAAQRWLTPSPRSPDGRLFALAEGNVIRLWLLPDSKAEQQQGFRWWIDPDYRWHAEQAAASWRAGDWFAAAFHLGRQFPERPWDARPHLRHAYALARLGRIPQAATCYVQAALLDPHLSPWPLDPAAHHRGQKAAGAGDWPGAVVEFELAVHQPNARFNVWSDLLLARARAAAKDRPLGCGEILDRFEKDGRPRELADSCLLAPSPAADADRLVRFTERLVTSRRDAGTLTLLGSAFYRAGRFEEAARTLAEAIKVHGKGGTVEGWLFLALAQQRLGRGAEARSNLARFEKWLKGQKFATWQEELRWRLLHEEARRLILTMPCAEQ
jgi:tetratricopeptide (TPR) repeat protein